MSLNPLKHIDPLGTIVIPVMLYLSTGGAFLFGYAKPVPVQFGNLRNPKRQMAWVALAGPAANFVMALMWLVSLMMLHKMHIDEVFLVKMAQAGISTNLVIFAFNLFPIPPLDGGRILTSILPNKYAYRFAKIEPYGFFIVLAMVLLHWVDFWMKPMIWITSTALDLLVFPLNFFLH